MRIDHRSEIALYLVVGIVALLAFAPAWAREGKIEVGRLDLSGAWTFVQVIPEIVVLPIVGEVELVNTVGGLIEIEEEGTILTMRGGYCLIEVDSGTPLIRIDIPDRFVDSLHFPAQTASLTITDDRIELVQGWQTEVRGAVLDDPEDDPLPDSADDPRVFDQDGDGKPGMTVKAAILGIAEGERYIVNRIRYRLVGRLIDPDTIAGRIEWRSEEETIGASSPLLAAAVPERPCPDPSGCRFVLRRIDGSFDCPDLRADLDGLVRFALNGKEG